MKGMDRYCAMTDDRSYTTFLRKEVGDLVNSFILTLGASLETGHDRMCMAIHKFCVELQECLTHCRSLPATVSGTVVEVMIQYNLLFGKLLRARCGQSVQQETPVLLTHSHSLLWSLQRVQEAVGMTVTQTTDNDDLCPLCCPVQKVGQQLSTLLRTLSLTSNQDLQQCVGLMACLWALITLLEKGASSPLPWLSPLAEYPILDDTMEVKFGFLVSSPPPVIQQAKQNRGSKPSSRGTVNSFAHFLMAALSFHRQQWQECKECVDKVNGPLWSPLANVLKARAMLGEGDSSGAIRQLQCVEKQKGLGPALLCQVHTALAACYTIRGLPILALRHLSQGQRLQPQSPSVLLLLANYAHLVADNADLEVTCLKSLVQVVEKNEGRQRNVSESLLPELLLEVMVCEHRPTLSQALYRLASRCSCLKRYEEASQAYLRLIKVYQTKPESGETSGHQCPPSLPLPDLLTICREAAQVMLANGDYGQCLHVSDRVLDAVSSSSLFSQPLLDSSLLPSSQNPDHSGVISQSDTTARRDALSQSGRKRRRSSTEEESEGWRGCRWWDEENRTLLVLCKAECLVVQGDYSAAFQILCRAVERLKDLHRRTSSSSVTSWQSTAPTSPHAKRPRCYPSQPRHAGEGGEVLGERPGEQEEMSWRQVSLQVCLALCDVQYRWKRPAQAIRFARLAVQINPEDERSQYYFFNTMLTVVGRVEGYQAWLRRRGLPHNTGAVLLQSAIRDTENRISSLAEDRAERPLGTVTDRQKAGLDLRCLSALAAARTKDNTAGDTG